MRLGFEEAQAEFQHAPQRARVWTEGWVAREMFCLNCGSPQLRQLPANSPVADFDCPACADQYEVKAKNGASFGPKVVNGQYDAKMARLGSATNPHLMLLSYNREARASAQRLRGAQALLRA